MVSRRRLIDATIIVLLPYGHGLEGLTVEVDGFEAEWDITHIYGFSFIRFTIDLEDDVSVNVQMV